MNRLKKEQLISLVNSQNDSINKLRESLLDKKEEVLQVSIQKIRELEQKNKELKKNICRETCEYFKRICNENTLLIKYRSALEEIREIAKDIIENDVYENSDAKAEQILNKINEVLK